MSKPAVHFGGPGAPRGALRELLAERIGAAKPGSAIEFVSYYFRDRRLASDLIRARDRGVAVRVTVDSRPRTPGANDAVASLLGAALGPSFRPVHHRRLPPIPRRRLHEKLYVFSDPPRALIGSFNPSTDDPEREPAILSEIGDHDAGYNSLVEFSDPNLVRSLAEHARELHAGRHGPTERWTAQRPSLRVGGTTIHYWPRLRGDPARAALRRLPAPGRIRIAASHLSGRTFPLELAAAARRGVEVEIVSHTSMRRFPEAVARLLQAAGVRVRRIGSDATAPMHEKFALLEGPDGAHVLCGSFNWNEQSRWFNHELLVATDEPVILAAYEQRWAEIGSDQ